jgi:hypothetical protein
MLMVTYTLVTDVKQYSYFNTSYNKKKYIYHIVIFKLLHFWAELLQLWKSSILEMTTATNSSKYIRKNPFSNKIKLYVLL